METGRLKNISEDIDRKLAEILGLNERKRGLGRDYFSAEEMMSVTSEVATEPMTSGASHRAAIKKSVTHVGHERLRKQALPFSVEGPWDVPHEKGPGGSVVRPEKARWIESLEEAKGVYIFAIKVDGSYTPIDVGKATQQGFTQEALNVSTLHTYQTALAKYVHATSILFFIKGPKNRGVPNGKAIKDIEKLFIAVAWLKHFDLAHKQHTPRTWSSSGVTGNGRGETSNAAQAVLDTLGFAHS